MHSMHSSWQRGLDSNTLTIVADVPSDRKSGIQLQTEWRVVGVKGAVLQPGADGLVTWRLQRAPMPRHLRGTWCHRHC